MNFDIDRYLASVRARGAAGPRAEAVVGLDRAVQHADHESDSAMLERVRAELAELDGPVAG